ncbi:PH domain-containing protein [Clostridium thermarum]|uniref:PH domain-containing protein n=1 Tax=Clostridium thermarum TaxID=1716543 RepID=UPI00111FC3D9|nr:PH domain-containing protein [Clostridium thermarum]
MENGKVIIKGSFRGITGDLVKNVLTILLCIIIFFFSKSYKNNIVIEHNIDTSFFNYLLKFEDITAVSILALIYLIIIIIVLVIISSIVKTLGLFYHLLRITTFDFNSGKVVDKAYSYPMNRTIDENKFNEIINVNIEQGLFQRIFNTGTLYVEYIAVNTVDSQLRHIEIPCVAKPFAQKNRLL